MRGGLADAAESVLKTLPSSSRSKATRAGVALAYLKIGNTQRAKELLEGIRGTPQYIVGLSRLAVQLVQEGNSAEGLEVSHSAAAAAFALPHTSAQMTFASVAGALVSSGDVDYAFVIAGSAEGDQMIQAATEEIASVLADRRDFDRASSLLDALSRTASADAVLLRLVRATATAGELSRAFEFLAQIQGHWGRAVARGTIAGLLDEMQQELQERLLNEAALIARESSQPARVLADTVAASCSITSVQRARRLLTEAFTYGTWTPLLPALARFDPDALARLADEFDHDHKPGDSKIHVI